MPKSLKEYVSFTFQNCPFDDDTVIFPVFQSSGEDGEVFSILESGIYAIAWRDIDFEAGSAANVSCRYSDAQLQWLHDNVSSTIPASQAAMEAYLPVITTALQNRVISIWAFTGDADHIYSQAFRPNTNAVNHIFSTANRPSNMVKYLTNTAYPGDFGSSIAIGGVYPWAKDANTSWVKAANCLAYNYTYNDGGESTSRSRPSGLLYNFAALTWNTPLYIAVYKDFPLIVPDYYGGASEEITNKINVGEVIPPTDDPFDTLPSEALTDPKGGNGNYNNGTDDIDFSDPDTDITVTALSSGFLTAYKVNSGILSRLGDAMWADADIIRDIFGGDIMGSIVSLTILPIEPTAGASQHIKLANWDTNISAPVITKQYVTVDMGSLIFNEYFSSYLDYAPNTKAEIYLPFIGERQLDIDDIMDASLHLKYQIDVLTGACVAQLKVTKKNTGGKHISELNSVMYSWDGNVANNMPLSGQSFANLYSAMVGGIGAALAVGISGGAAAPVVGAVSSAANILGSSKPTINRSGNLGGGTGLLSVQKPYVTLSRPVQSIAPSALALTGYPSNVGGQLSNFSGFIKINKIDLDNIACTAEEAEEIRRLMAGGVYVD